MGAIEAVDVDPTRAGTRLDKLLAALPSVGSREKARQALKSGKVSVDYGVYGVPETFFIDRAGAIRVKHVSAVTDQVFRDTVEALLAEPAPPR